MLPKKRRRRDDHEQQMETDPDQFRENGEEMFGFDPAEFDRFRERLLTTEVDKLKRKHVKPFLEMLNANKENPHFRAQIGPRCDLHFLAALLHHYRCTLSFADRLIYAILELLERHFCLDFRIASPLVFGPASKAYYEELIRYGRALHKYLTPEQVLGYFDQKQIWESLVRLAHFDRHYSAALSTGSNADGAMEAAVDKVGISCYDPRFVLRLLVHLVAPGTKLSCPSIVHSNALSFALASTSFHSASLRSLAYAFLERFRARLTELSEERFPERLMFRHVLGLLKNSLTAGNQRTTHVASQFLARLAKLIMLPAEPVYAPLMSSLCQRPWLQLDTVPEFLRLFFSTSTENCLRERQWMLRLLSNTIVDAQDYGAVCKVYAIESCMALWSSPMADFWAKLLLLKVFGACVHLQSAARDLFRRLDFAGWLTNAISHPRSTVMELLELVSLFRQLCERLELDKKQMTKDQNSLAYVLERAKMRLCAGKIVTQLRGDERIAIDRHER